MAKIAHRPGDVNDTAKLRDQFPIFAGSRLGPLLSLHRSESPMSPSDHLGPGPGQQLGSSELSLSQRARQPIRLKIDPLFQGLEKTI